MSLLGLYEPGSSVLHRLPAGWKFLGLLVFSTGLLLLRSPWMLAGLAVAVALGYGYARIRLRRCWQALRVSLPVLVLIFGMQWWLVSLDSAAQVSLRLFAAIGAANLFTLTTRVDDLVDAVERGLAPTRRLGVRPDQIGLLVGLTLQAIAALSSIVADTRDAQRARGATRSVAAFAVPLLIRTLRHADELGEALAARGVGDDDQNRRE